MKSGKNGHSKGFKRNIKNVNALGYKIDRGRIWFFKPSWFSLFIILSSIVLNLFGRFLCTKLCLPAWGDFAGTIVAAIALGPFAGALVGVSVNVINCLFTQNYIDLGYSIVGAVCGFIMGFAFPRDRRWEDPFTVSIVGFYCSIAAAVISTPLNLLIYDGYTGNVWGDALVDYLSRSITVRPICCFLGEIFIDFPDKVITSVLTGGSYMFVRAMLRKKRENKEKEDRKTRSKEDIGSISEAVALFIVAAAAAACVFPITASAAPQTGETFLYEYTDVEYGLSDGLPSLELTDVVQTPNGYIWVGGYSGLYRFDGNRFYRVNLGEGVSSVTTLFADSNGDLWVGTNDVGVVKYVVSTGEIKSYDLSWGLPSESIRSICEDWDGTIYIGTVSSLASISRAGIVGINDNDSRLMGIISMDADKDGNVVGVTEFGDLFMMRGGRLMWAGESRYEDRYYTTVDIDDKGDAYVGTSGNYIDRYKIINGAMAYMETISTGKISLIRDILYDDVYEGYFFCGDTGMGFLANDYKVTDISVNNFDTGVQGVTFDYQGNVWYVSDKQGAMKYARRPFEELMGRAGLEPEVVNATFEKSGELFVGTDNGLFVINVFFGERKDYDYLKEFEGLRIRHIMEDSKANLWISTYGPNGLMRISPDGSVTSFNDKSIHTLGTRFRQSLELSNGDIVACTNQGLNYIRGDELIDTVGVADGLENTKILTMVEDADGRLFCGSDGGGIFVVEKGKVTDHIENTDGLKSLVVLRIIPIGNSEYLYVTSNAIYYNDGHNIRKLENFPYTNNYDVLITDTDVAWIASSAGYYICRLEDMLADKPDYGYELLNYTRGFTNSLSSNSWSAYFDHKIYSCCSGGVEVVDTLSYNSFSQDYLVDIGNIGADGERIEALDGVYHIPSEVTHITIRPSVLNYALSNPLVHFYVEGIDDIDETLHQIDITEFSINGLKAGEYTIYVQVLDEFTGAIQKEAKFKMIKDPMFYETMKFRAYGLFVVLFFVAYVGWIIARINNMAIRNVQYDLVEEAKVEAERANAAKSEFLAQMSHEIRTPINSVLGMDEMILREATNPDILAYANDIYTAGRTLLSLINDILDQSKIESGKLEIVDVDYEIASLMNDLYNMISQRAEVKGLEFNISVEPGMPIRYVGDDVRIRQVVINLLTNAVKYTPAGTVWLRLSGTRKNDKKEILHFEVEDTGIGIKEQDLPHLFDQYQRFDDIKNRHIEGTGLGLAIAKHLLELMYSDLKVKSTYGEGTKFWFDLEQEILDETPIGDFNERMKELNVTGSILDNKGKGFIAPDAKVLVVDDNGMNRRVFKSLLKQTKVQIHEASGGAESVELAKKEKYDIIFMDHMMPEVDGIDALHMIREDEDSPNRDTPIVVLTANAVTGAKEKYLEEGFNGFLSKPVAGEKLEKTIRHILPEDMMKPAPAEDRKAGMVAEPGAEVPEDLPDVEGLDWSFAWLHLPERQLLEDTVREFYELIHVHADKLDNMYAEILTVRDALDNGAPVPPEEPIRDLGDIPDKLPDPQDQAFDAYRIQVHGMKSAAATIGIVPLAGMAKMLEFAARDHDMSVIGSMHSIFIDEWRRYKDKMMGVFGVGMEDESDREEAKPGMLMGYAMMLRSAMENMDVDQADEIVGRIKHLKFNDEIDSRVPLLAAAVVDLDEDEVNRLLTEMEEYDK
ncbi:MAG: response regulator [Lachnospiraceae bacterium]|nr:response regulator [Lachnospiraceae bacterium]